MKLYLLKYGEITLKGKNRHFFERKLLNNIKQALKGLHYEIEFYPGRIYVRSDEEVLKPLKQVLGLVGICEADVAELSMDALKEKAVEVMKDLPVKTFKVVTKRTNKKFPMQSPEISSELGAHLLKSLNHLQVDVHEPELYLEVEIREEIYLYTHCEKGLGGLPYGSAGKSVHLMSGGIDSPVAFFQMARRGVTVVPLHFHSMPLTSQRSLEKVRDLLRVLTDYVGPIDFYHINLFRIQTAIKEVCEDRYFTILQRRMMTKLADRLASDLGALVLSTGENIAQVASQTLEGLVCTDDASTKPILRPLISLDKTDIVDMAKSLQTFETSILPFDDCCTVFLPEKVATRPRLEDVLREEAKLDVQKLLDEAMDTMVKEVIWR